MIELVLTIATNLGALALGFVFGRVTVKVARQVRRHRQLPISRFEGHERFEVPIRCAIRFPVVQGNRRMNALEQLNVRE